MAQPGCNETIPVKGSKKGMPVVGFIACCHHAEGSPLTDRAVSYLKSGGRLLDTAPAYSNEAEIGKAVRLSGVPREDIWVTTKLLYTYAKPTSGQGWRERVSFLVDKSLQNLRLDYVDVMYLHFGPAASGNDLTSSQDVELWRGLIDAKRAGKVRNLGVCLHTKSEIELLTRETGEPPVVAAFWYSPFGPLETQEYASWLKSQEIAVNAYGSFNWKEEWSPSRDSQMDAINFVRSQHSHAGLGQIIVRWALDQGIALMTNSNPEESRENLKCLPEALTVPDLSAIAAAPHWDCSSESGQLFMGCEPKASGLLLRLRHGLLRGAST